MRVVIAYYLGCGALTRRCVVLLLFSVIWMISARIASRWRMSVWNSRVKLHCGNHWARHCQRTVSGARTAQMLLSLIPHIILIWPFIMLNSMRFFSNSFTSTFLWDEGTLSVLFEHVRGYSTDQTTFFFHFCVKIKEIFCKMQWFFSLIYGL